MANALLFLTYALLRRHVQRDLLPTKNDIIHLPRKIVDHIQLRFPKGEAAKRYNGLQKLADRFVIFVLGPLIVLTGLTMSPTMDSAFPQLLWIFHGRQSAQPFIFSARSHFLGFSLCISSWRSSRAVGIICAR